MKLIESKAEYIPQESGIEGIYKMIEVAGRTAYHSQDKITPTSAKDFVDKMIKSKHGAALEHGTVYLKIPIHETRNGKLFWINSSNIFYENNPFSKSINDRIFKLSLEDNAYIVTNYRVIVENSKLDDLQYLCSPTEFHEKRYTMRFTCSRAIANELVRHRTMSFLQESTRYINYSKECHGGEITFIKPSWFKENQLSVDSTVAQPSDTNGAVFYERPYKTYYLNGTEADGFDWYKEDFFIHSCQTAERCYLLMLEEGATPQQARDVLPNATKTELVVTGFASDWARLFELRLYESTGKVVPDMKVLMQKAWKEFENYGITGDLERYIKL